MSRYALALAVALVAVSAQPKTQTPTAVAFTNVTVIPMDRLLRYGIVERRGTEGGGGCHAGM